jgi:hypothetical protein
MREPPPITEADILTELVDPNCPDLDPEAARAVLALKFSRPATTKIRGLLRRNNQGTITANERITLDRYLRIGQFLDLIQAKAKRSLGQRARAH